MFLSRRTFLGGAALAMLSTAVSAAESCWPKKPSVPTDFNAEEFFVELSERGTGFSFGPRESANVVLMTFDTQCRWCVWQYRQFEPYLDRVRFVWHPVAVLNPWSELQGAAILSATNPQERFLEHEAHMNDASFKGLDVRSMTVPWEKREAVWANTKIFRRSGAREVPFGVLKTADGRYVPIAEQTGEAFGQLTKL